MARPSGVGMTQQPVLDLHWQERAACVGMSPKLFSDKKLAHWATRVCEGCSVRKECSEIRGEAEGVWGGRTHFPKQPRGRYS